MRKDSANLNASEGGRVCAIALDAPNQDLFLDWQARGLLPNLRDFLKRSAQARVTHAKQYSNEHCWIPILTGMKQDRWDHWLGQWDPETYRYSEASLYNWSEAPLFYALGDSRKVAAFDLSGPVAPGVNGIQVAGWATDLNESFPESRPGTLISELVERYGSDPKTLGAQVIRNRLNGRSGVSYRVPSAYDADALRRFRDALVESAERRGQICGDLLQRDAWDLFIMLFSETHTAGHVLWHQSQPHPLAKVAGGDTTDALLAVYQAADRSFGELLKAVDDDTYVLLFTVDSMVADCLENARSLFLPEFLYRWCFGEAALAAGEPGGVPPRRLDYAAHWKEEVWKLRTPRGDAVLTSPAQQEGGQDPLSWCPTDWYAPCWPQMRAFALPSVAEGYIRVNVAGREANGRVARGDYPGVCEQLTRDLTTLVNARTGEPMVSEVIRVRDDPFDKDRKKPPADLIVVWREQEPPDVVDSSLVGRIGPVPYFRSGSHQIQGTPVENLVFLNGPGIPAGQQLAPGLPEDIPATILALMGLDPPAHFDGVPLMDRHSLARTRTHG